MKSKKRVKELNEIVLPYLLTPNKYLQGGINGKMYEYLPGKTYEITPAIFESLYLSGYDFS